MRVNPLHIVGIYLTVSVYIALGKVGKLVFTANMRINSLHIVGINLPISIHIPDEIHRHILGNITVAYRDLLGERACPFFSTFRVYVPAGTVAKE